MPLETDSMFERLGGLELPVRTAEIDGSGLASLDPGRDLLLELFAAAINSELSEAWTATCATLPAAHPFREAPVTPVRDTLPDEPTEQILRQRVGRFPMLAIHRSGIGRYEQMSLEITRLVQPWTLHYILGPLDIIDQRKLKDACVAVAKIVALVVRRRGHASFQSGALQFFSGDEEEPFRGSQFASIRIDSHEGPGQAAFGGEASTTMYWAMEIKLETTETSGYDPEAEGDLDAMDLTVGVGGDEGITPALVIGASDQDPQG